MLKKLFQKYIAKSIDLSTSRTTPLLNSSDAIAFLIEGLFLGLDFHGIEGFQRVDSQYIQPIQSISTDIADFSNHQEFIDTTLQVLFDNIKECKIGFEIVFTEAES